MELINTTPFLFAPITGQINFPKHSLTFIVKATFDLKINGKVTIAEEQLFPTGDEHYPDDEEQTGSIRYESDFAHFKPHADILLVGKCHTPNKKPMTVCPVILNVGNAEKKLAVFGNRVWKNTVLNPETTEAVPFSEMDLRYERSFGGADYKLNPVGRGYCKADVTIAENALPVPNIQNPNDLVSLPTQEKQPAGFGPINRSWSLRQDKMGSYKGTYLKERWPWLPEDFDWSFYNAAPLNQQVPGFLKGDERLYLENLHPKFSQYHTSLPRIRPRCFTRRIDPANKKKFFDEVDLNLDTLWIDMEAEKLVLVWRGWCPVIDDDYEELLNIFLISEALTQTPASLEQCHEQFIEERKKQDEMWGLTPEEPETIEDDESINKVTQIDKETKKASSPKLDPKELESQINAFLAKIGFDITNLPPETQAQIKQQQAELLKKPTETDTTKSTASEQEAQDAALTGSFADLGVDINNLPPLSDKAKQEQLRFFKEMGLEDVDTAPDAQGEKYAMMMAALLPKIGINPENLDPLIKQAKPQLAELKFDMSPVSKTANEEQHKTDQAEKNLAEKLVLQQRLDNNESLANEDFSGKDLSGLNFNNANLNGAIFIGSNLSNTNLENTNLTQATLNTANLSHAQMKGADCTGADLSHTQMNDVIATNAVFRTTLLTGAILNAADLTGADLTAANLSNAELNKVTLKQACLNDADMSNTQLVEAHLDGAELNDTNFEKSKALDSHWIQVSSKDANFCEADLSNSVFTEASLIAADFSQCRLSGANFQSANLTEAKMEGVNAENSTFFKANLTKIRASDYSNFSNTNFSRAIGNESIWKQANLNHADFSYAQMHSANFVKASLCEANFTAADLKFASFLKADLTQAKMVQMNLFKGSLEKANLKQADLRGSNLYGVEFLNAHLEQTVILGANLKSSKLENAG